MSILDDLADACERATGQRPDFEARRPIPHDEWEAECRQAERGQDRLRWAGYATDREMDGAAADYVYGREPAGDWRRP